MKNFQILLSAFLVFCVSAAASAGGDLKSTIQARETAWSAAYNANDASALGAFYEADAVLIAPGMTPVTGRAMIEETLSQFFPALKDLTLTTDMVIALGDNRAVEIGHSNYTSTAADGTSMSGGHNYQVVWHKGEDGVWRYVTDMFNARP